MAFRYSFSASAERAEEFEQRIQSECEGILDAVDTTPLNGKVEVISFFNEDHHEAESAIFELLEDLDIDPDGIGRELELSFHGRIIDHLGIQMYQSPVAAVAEMVSNSWDADSTEVKIELPNSTDDLFEISDDGSGMTYAECEHKYLAAGIDPRGGDPEATTDRYERPLLGRKGIGKFAGFGIAKKILIETVSRKTGEKTVFEMNLEDIRGDGTQYAGGSIGVDVLEYEGPDDDRIENHGTVVILDDLMMGRAPSPAQFRRSMGRRFTLQDRADNFEVYVNGDPMSDDRDVAGIQFSFPEDYEEDEKPDALEEIDDEGWGKETLEDGNEIRWKFDFYEDTIDEEELAGIAVFANGKLAQKPFLFNMSGGAFGQGGIQYLSGQVEADYLDQFDQDLIAPERQRINWGLEITAPLESWGEERIRSLLSIWAERRKEEKKETLRDELDEFGDRLSDLPNHEQETVEEALVGLTNVDRLSNERFKTIGKGVIEAWEKGRLRNLIDDMASMEDMEEGDLLDILLEAKVLNSLQTAEAVLAKYQTIIGLRERVEKNDLEDAVRNHIADNPWLISPMWETFEREKSVKRLTERAAKEVDLQDLEGYHKRTDLSLSSGPTLLILEFMRPGKSLDRDHLNRFQAYVDIVREKVEAETKGKLQSVIGYLVADDIGSDPGLNRAIRRLEEDEMYAYSWENLIGQAEDRWASFFQALVSRAPQDTRLEDLEKRFNTLYESAQQSG